MLNHRVAIYIPSTVDGNKPANPGHVDQWIEESKILLANLFGGFTAFKAHGGYYSATKGLIEESITVVQAFTDVDSTDKFEKVKDLAKKIAISMRQEVVSVEIDGSLQFISG